jgi:hypothetical protein
MALVLLICREETANPQARRPVWTLSVPLRHAPPFRVTERETVEELLARAVDALS